MSELEDRYSKVSKETLARLREEIAELSLAALKLNSRLYRLQCFIKTEDEFYTPKQIQESIETHIQFFEELSKKVSD